MKNEKVFRNEVNPDFHANAFGDHTIDSVVTNPRLANATALESASTNHLRSWKDNIPPSIRSEGFAWACFWKSLV